MILRDANWLQIQWDFGYAVNTPAKEQVSALLYPWNLSNLVQDELVSYHIFLPEPLKGTVSHSNHCWKSGHGY